MKRYIKSAEELDDEKVGFVFTAGNKEFFLESSATNITDKIARIFINAVCDLRGVGDGIRRSALYDPATLKDFKYRIDKAVLITHVRDWGTYYTISGKNFSQSFPEADFNKDVILL